MNSILTSAGTLVAVVVAIFGLWQALKKDRRSARDERLNGTVKGIETAWRLQDEAIQRLERARDRLELDVSSLRGQMDHSDAEIDSLRRQVSKLESEKEELKEENRELRRRLDRYEGEHRG